MQVTITADQEAKQLTITVTDVNWEEIQGGSFYQGEQQVQHLLTRIGHDLTRQLLAGKVTRPPSLQHAGQRWYRKADSPGQSLTLYGPIRVSRPTYQTSSGGETFCPLEADCQLACGAATPLLAEIVSFKLSALTAREVQQDLAKTHGLALSASFLQQTAQRVGAVAVDKATTWQLSDRESAQDVAVIATGLDGTTLPLVDEDYKEAMCGTLALYDETGERLTTEYLGALPEAGKRTFTELFTTRVSAMRTRYPQALHVVLADGALWNWQLLEGHYPEAVAVLDCYHAAQHLAAAADVLCGSTPSAQNTAWYERWRTVLRDDLDGVAQVIRTLISHRNRAPLAEAAAQTLDTELQYFRRNADKMRYALYRAAGLPIGSGVTEAGCKELIKARFCRSGMRWKRETAAPILHLRAIRLSQQWDRFWKKVLRYAA
ncbi:MAG: ISKra4 family transposase [Thermodesulfobacteriota bacterium]|jgi:hypothetical protein